MFNVLELMYTALELMYTALELMFTGGEQKILLDSETSISNANKTKS